MSVSVLGGPQQFTVIKVGVANICAAGLNLVLLVCRSSDVNHFFTNRCSQLSKIPIWHRQFLMMKSRLCIEVVKVDMTDFVLQLYRDLLRLADYVSLQVCRPSCLQSPILTALVGILH